MLDVKLIVYIKFSVYVFILYIKYINNIYFLLTI